MGSASLLLWLWITDCYSRNTFWNWFYNAKSIIGNLFPVSTIMKSDLFIVNIFVLLKLSFGVRLHFCFISNFFLQSIPSLGLSIPLLPILVSLNTHSLDDCIKFLQHDQLTLMYPFSWTFNEDTSGFLHRDTIHGSIYLTTVHNSIKTLHNFPLKVYPGLIHWTWLQSMLLSHRLIQGLLMIILIVRSNSSDLICLCKPKTFIGYH